MIIFIYRLSSKDQDKSMCGRLSIIDYPLCKIVSETTGVNFNSESNDNLCPSESVSTIVQSHEQLTQVNMQWGIQPSWSKRLLINAQSETVDIKPTFAQAFASHRCLIPCSGWYEWRKEGSKKQKYYFSHAQEQPLYMAGVSYYGVNTQPQVVILTTKPNSLCEQYHHRMPVLILPENINVWLQPTSPSSNLSPLMSAIPEQHLQVITN
ncbi:SOS response-associated peptidase [Cognaticolwellia beringensis]|uniref:Abasic site processing protein n=1 Tax=Cognaticolwellia beringensis TaxID=1967665 RepID=A0A222G6A1_9GAMM|nr:SOS response-associated peptidase [Cognaticolwellia beringensis]ASP47320.1 SOS response-associated peptidase [Cognaticolwellia beringensis]